MGAQASPEIETSLRATRPAQGGRRQPLVPVACALAAGISLDETAGGLALAMCGALVGVSAAWRWRQPTLLSAAILLVFTCVSALREHVASIRAPGDISQITTQRYVTVGGYLATDLEPAGQALMGEMEATRVMLPGGEARPCSGRLVIRLPSSDRALLDYGDRLAVHGRLEPPEPARNPGAFDYARYLSHRRIYAVLTARRASDIRMLPASPSFINAPARFAAQCRRSIRQTLARLLPRSEASLLAGIMLGGRAEMPSAMADDFAATGTAHILAASGMNVGMMAALLFGLCRVGRVGRRRAVLTTIAGIAFYTLVAGAKPSVVRADLMATLFLAGVLLDRRMDLANALAAAAILLLAVDPGYLFDAGFQLSFACVAGIIAASPLISAVYQRIRTGIPGAPSSRAGWLAGGAAATLTVSAVAQLASAPITAHYFNQVSLVGLAANALIVPVLGILLSAGFAVWGLAAVMPGMAHVLANAVLSPALVYLVGAVHACAGLTGAAVSVPSPGWAFIATYYAALATGLRWVNRRLARGGSHVP